MQVVREGVYVEITLRVRPRPFVFLFITRLMLEGSRRELAYDFRRGGIEPGDVEHPRVVRIGYCEAAACHSHNNQPRRDSRLLPVLP